MPNQPVSQSETRPCGFKHGDPLPEEQEVIEAGAMEAWRQVNGTEPTEPLREKGGALDPNAYCMKLARAIVDDEPLPRLSRDQATPEGLRDAVADAMSACYYESED